MPTTPRGVPYPATGGPNNAPADIKAVADWITAGPGTPPSTTVPRWAASTNVELLPGRLEYAPIWLAAGQKITTIRAVIGNTQPVGHTHHWFVLYSPENAKLAVTVDGLGTSWSAEKSLAVAGGPLTVPTTGWHVVGVLVAGASCSLLGNAGAPTRMSRGYGAHEAAATGLTTPATAPDAAVGVSVSEGNNPVMFVQVD